MSMSPRRSSSRTPVAWRTCVGASTMRTTRSRVNKTIQPQAALDHTRELYQRPSARCGTKTTRAPPSNGDVRREHSALIMARFHTWLEQLAPRVLPQSPLGKAIYYALGQWSKLTVFLTDGNVPIDNNRCENAIRPFVIGRKGWLFANTVNGAKASANLYSLVETCKANDVEPHAYLSILFERLPSLATVEHFDALLPWNMKPSAAAAAPALDRNHVVS